MHLRIRPLVLEGFPRIGWLVYGETFCLWVNPYPGMEILPESREITKNLPPEKHWTFLPFRDFAYRQAIFGTHLTEENLKAFQEQCLPEPFSVRLLPGPFPHLQESHMLLESPRQKLLFAGITLAVPPPTVLPVFPEDSLQALDEQVHTFFRMLAQEACRTADKKFLVAPGVLTRHTSFSLKDIPFPIPWKVYEEMWRDAGRAGTPEHFQPLTMSPFFRTMLQTPPVPLPSGPSRESIVWLDPANLPEISREQVLILDTRPPELVFARGFLRGTLAVPPRYVDEWTPEILRRFWTDASKTPVWIVSEEEPSALSGKTLRTWLRLGWIHPCKAHFLPGTRIPAEDMVIGISAEEFSLDYRFDIHEFSVVDVRPPALVEEGYVQGADALSLEELLDLPPDALEIRNTRTKVYVYGRDEEEALMGGLLLRKLGVPHVLVIRGNFRDFYDVDLPIIRTVHFS